MLLYLDANCFNRPFDDQAQNRIREETYAVLEILQRIVDGHDLLVWSTALTIELTAHPEEEIRTHLLGWEKLSQSKLTSKNVRRERIEALVTLGLKTLDATHVAFAESGNCEVFLTCDDRLLRTAKRLVLPLRSMNPVEYLQGVQ